ncbi:hypothetical protein [Enemella evansiae]|uniref:hypothetical protein n=1 Tax=Enemella evansiae TaxID=2016499 RepID=UPI00105BBE59|nr:hypothetical protein [Enemella evansiae]TDO89850.1 hypothetical protein C8D81_2734 [Enemella evansiae]
MAESVRLQAPDGVRPPAGVGRLLDAAIPCQLCGEPIGEVANLLIERAPDADQRGEWLRVRPRHPACGPAEEVLLDAPAQLDPSRGVHRVGCVALPDDRPALLVNPDVDAPVFRGDHPVLAELLEGAGWVAWPRPPQPISGWVQVRTEDPAAPVVEVLTGLGSIVLDPAPPEWAALVTAAGELPVLALLDHHVDDWLQASGWTQVAELLDRGVLMAGLVQVLPDSAI